MTQNTLIYITDNKSKLYLFVVFTLAFLQFFIRKLQTFLTMYIFLKLLSFVKIICFGIKVPYS